jgi:hypothetical protein
VLREQTPYGGAYRSVPNVEAIMVDTFDFDRDPDLYRARARKMRELAVDALDEHVKAELLSLAEQFDFLAVGKTRVSADQRKKPGPTG